MGKIFDTLKREYFDLHEKLAILRRVSEALKRKIKLGDGINDQTNKRVKENAENDVVMTWLRIFRVKLKKNSTMIVYFSTFFIFETLIYM